ncbi:MAG: phosphatidylserine decarboxylase family protein [bacterium]
MIAREGLLFIMTGLVVTVPVIWAALRWDSWWLFGVGALLALLTLFCMFFFRDPPRQCRANPVVLLAPADGTIVKIDNIENQPHIGGRATRVAIFLSIFDVHINRIPIDGRVDFVTYRPGKFFAAYKDNASEANERTEIGLTSASGQRLVVRQIAGVLARRIVCRIEDGDNVKAGEKFGMIRFGSRTELLIPAGSEVRVQLGEKVRAGLTVLAKLPEGAAAAAGNAAREADVEI